MKNKQNSIRIISLMLLVTMGGWVQPVKAMPVFTDLNGHWAQEAVLASASCDLIKGYADKSFKPEQALTELEALVLFMKTQGYALDKVKASKKAASTIRNPNIPVVPWGQNYLDTAFEKQLLPPAWVSGFSYNTPATREQVALLLGRLLILPYSEAALSTEEPAAFSDISELSEEAQAYIYLLNQKAIMSGFTDGKFHPQQPLKRSEAASLLAKLMQGNWVKTSPSLDSRQMQGWVKTLSMSGKKPELELASLQGVQKLKLDPQLKCFRDGKECFYQEAVNSQVRLYLDQKKQVTVISLLEKMPAANTQEELFAKVKSVVIGEDNLLVVYDLNGKIRTLPLAGKASLESLKSQSKGFQSLKAGTFVKAYISDDEVVRVTELKTLSISGIVTSISTHSLYLEQKAVKDGQPISFEYWDRARIIDKDGNLMNRVVRGDKVKISYLNPVNEVDYDEIPIEIVVSSRSDLKIVKGEVDGFPVRNGSKIITIKKNKEYMVDDNVKVFNLITDTQITLNNLKVGDKIQMYVDGAGVVMKIIQDLEKVKGEIVTVSSNSIIINKNKKYMVDNNLIVLDGADRTNLQLSNLQAGDQIEMYVDGAEVVMKVIRLKSTKDK